MRVNPFRIENSLLMNVLQISNLSKLYDSKIVLPNNFLEIFTKYAIGLILVTFFLRIFAQFSLIAILEKKNSDLSENFLKPY